jgi:hypothetical protein
MDFSISSRILLFNIAHIRGISAVRDPFSRCSWRSLFQHAINLLKGKTLGLGDEHIGVDEAKEAKGAPKEEHLGTEIRVTGAITDEVRCDNSDDLERS